MFSKTIRPRWWLLDVIMVFVMGLLMLDARAHLSESGHQIAAVAVVLVWLVLITAWLRANASAIEQANGRSNPRMQRILPGHITVYRGNPLPENRAGSSQDAATHLLITDTSPASQSELRASAPVELLERTV